MWPRTKLIDRLEIEHPLLQAPMGGESTPEMAIAVGNAGGLGGLGCSYMSNEHLSDKVAQIRQGTSAPFNLNFFVHSPPAENPEIYAHTRERIAPFYAELGIDEFPHPLEAPCDTFTQSRLECLLDLRPRVVSFHFGLPDIAMVRALQDTDCLVISSATTVAEARWLEAAGIDAIIAQGWEAGGHRGTFHVSHEDFGVGGLALIPQIVDAVDLPVIAAGGISDGRGIAAALVLGASAVQLGSAFLSCPEANINDAYREALQKTSDDATRLTSAFSGRPARAMNNRYIESMARSRAPLPDYPTMYSFSDPLRLAGEKARKPGFEFYLWGQAAALNRECSSADLVHLLVKEAQDALHSAAGTKA
jgi:nitronate monooxygenase